MTYKLQWYACLGTQPHRARDLADKSTKYNGLAYLYDWHHTTLFGLSTPLKHNMSYPTFALLLVCAVGASFALIIDSPRWGDTISSKSFTITWHDIANVEDPIALTLMQGESSSTLHGVMTINCKCIRMRLRTRII